MLVSQSLSHSLSYLLSHPVTQSAMQLSYSFSPFLFLCLDSAAEAKSNHSMRQWRCSLWHCSTLTWLNCDYNSCNQLRGGESIRPVTQALTRAVLCLSFSFLATSLIFKLHLPVDAAMIKLSQGKDALASLLLNTHTTGTTRCSRVPFHRGQIAPSNTRLRPRKVTSHTQVKALESRANHMLPLTNASSFQSQVTTCSYSFLFASTFGGTRLYSQFTLLPKPSDLLAAPFAPSC